MVWVKLCILSCSANRVHEIFSLETGELGCTDLAKHEMRVVKDEPFKERFQRIPPLMAEEVRAHVKEMWKWHYSP